MDDEAAAPSSDVDAAEPQRHGGMVAKAVKLRGGDAKVPLRPVAIKPECLRVIPRPKAAEAEECD